MPTKKEFEDYIQSLERRIRLIQELNLDKAVKEDLIDELLEKISIATKYFLPDEDEQ